MLSKRIVASVSLSIALCAVGTSCAPDGADPQGDRTVEQLIAGCEPALDQSQPVNTNNFSTVVSDTQIPGQSFVPSVSGDLVKVRVELQAGQGWAGGMPVGPGDLIAQIRTMGENPSQPSETIIGSVTVPADNFTLNTRAWYDIEFTEPVALEAGTTYALTLTMTPVQLPPNADPFFDRGGTYSWLLAGSWVLGQNAYDAGREFVKVPFQADWLGNADVDYAFETFMAQSCGDVDAPLVTWGANAPDRSGDAVQVSREDGFSIANLAVFDVGGLASVEIVLNGTQTLLSETWFPSTQAPQSGFTCTPGACVAPENQVFSYGGPSAAPLPDGDHCAVLTATDEAGNATTQTFCWRIGGPTLTQLREDSATLCDLIDAELTPYAGHADPDVVATAAAARATCSDAALACLNSDTAQLGCVIQALVSSHKLIANIEALGGGEHLTLRERVVATTRDTLFYVESAWPNNNARSFQNGSDATAQVVGAGTAAMSAARDAFFWFEDARRPFPALGSEGASCEGLEALSAELDAYATDDGLVATAEVSAAQDLLDEARASLCGSGLGEGAPCYDRNFILGLSQLMDTASSLKTMGDADLGEPSTLVWTRNWQLGVARVAQFWLNLSLDNFDLWANAGGVAPGYEEIRETANANWGDAEALLDEGDIDTFIATFIDPASRCLMYDAFEYVDDWWEDAANVAECGAGLDYPDVCFNDDGLNRWPLHGVEVAGDAPLADGECLGNGDCGASEVCVSGVCVGDAATGLRFTLQWDGPNDLDLHLDTPESPVYYDERSANGCTLDTDMGSGPGAVESINCQASDADFVQGTFSYRVTNYSGPDAPTYTLSVFRDGELVETFTETVPANGPEDPHDDSVQGAVRTIAYPEGVVTPTPDFLWLDATDADSITRDHVGNVTQWRDKSGLNRHANLSGAPPVWQSNVTPGGTAAIRFNGSSTRLQTGSVPSSPTMTIFVVYRMNTPQTWGSIINQGHDAYFSIRKSDCCGGGGNLNFHIRNNNTTPLLPLNTGSWRLLTVMQDATTTTMYTDPEDPAQANQPPITPGAAPISIGNSILNGQSMGGEIAEIRAFGSALDEATRAAIEAELEEKFALDAQAPPGELICGSVGEGFNMPLTCPAGTRVTSVEFASYGLPSGSCGAFFQGGCHAPTSQSAVEASCLGQASCVVPATNTTFGDPCGGIGKRLFVQATCSP